MARPTIDLVTLTFRLPRQFGLVPSGRFFPCRYGCRVIVDHGHAQVTGKSREGCIQQALSFIKVHARGGFIVDDIPVVIAGGGYAGGRDHGHISIGTEPVFTYGGIEPVRERVGAP